MSRNGHDCDLAVVDAPDTLLQRIPMRARVVACLLQLATVDLTLRRYDTDGRRSDEHRAARKPALSVQRPFASTFAADPFWPVDPGTANREKTGSGKRRHRCGANGGCGILRARVVAARQRPRVASFPGLLLV